MKLFRNYFVAGLLSSAAFFLLSFLVLFYNNLGNPDLLIALIFIGGGAFMYALISLLVNKFFPNIKTYLKYLITSLVVCTPLFLDSLSTSMGTLDAAVVIMQFVIYWAVPLLYFKSVTERGSEENSAPQSSSEAPNVPNVSLLPLPTALIPNPNPVPEEIRVSVGTTTFPDGTTRELHRQVLCFAGDDEDYHIERTKKRIEEFADAEYEVEEIITMNRNMVLNQGDEMANYLLFGGTPYEKEEVMTWYHFNIQKYSLVPADYYPVLLANLNTLLQKAYGQILRYENDPEAEKYPEAEADFVLGHLFQMGIKLKQPHFYFYRFLSDPRFGKTRVGTPVSKELNRMWFYKFAIDLCTIAVRMRMTTLPHALALLGEMDLPKSDYAYNYFLSLAENKAEAGVGFYDSELAMLKKRIPQLPVFTFGELSDNEKGQVILSYISVFYPKAVITYASNSEELSRVDKLFFSRLECGVVITSHQGRYGENNKNLPVLRLGALINNGPHPDHENVVRLMVEYFLTGKEPEKENTNLQNTDTGTEEADTASSVPSEESPEDGDSKVVSISSLPDKPEKSEQDNDALEIVRDIFTLALGEEKAEKVISGMDSEKNPQKEEDEPETKDTHSFGMTSKWGESRPPNRPWNSP